MTMPHINTKESLNQERPDRAGVRDRSQGRIGRAFRYVREHGLGEVVQLVRTHGLRQSLYFVLRNVRHMIAVRADQAFDHRHGVDTGGSIQIEFLDVLGSNREYAREYVATSPKSFDWLMKHVDRKLDGYTFIDFGSGKGRCLLLASKYPFSRIIGVEFAKELVTIANKNILRHRPRLAVVQDDATAFKMPAEPLLLYFHNPFTREVFERVLANIEGSLTANPRDAVLVYAASNPAMLDWVRPSVLESGRFREIETKPMPVFLDAVRTLNFAVFEIRKAQAA